MTQIIQVSLWALAMHVCLEKTPWAHVAHTVLLLFRAFPELLRLLWRVTRPDFLSDFPHLAFFHLFSPCRPKGPCQLGLS